MEELVVLQPIHKELILDFENERLGKNPSFEDQMLSWDARWRSEALDHYLNLGWSFGVFRDGKLHSYILSQPFVFFRGLTQTLWVEWIGAYDLAGANRAIEVAYRWARDKHFQSLVLEDKQKFSQFALESTFSFEAQNGFLVLKTSKMK